MMTHTRGFTLIELMVTVVVVAVLATLAVPSFRTSIEKRRVVAAAEAAYSDLQFTKSETIKQSRNLFANFSTGGGDWCAGVSETTGCDCTETDVTAADACTIKQEATDVLKTITSDTYPNTTLTAAHEFEFNEVRGTLEPGSNGTVTFRSPHNYEMRVIVSSRGRIRMCSPSGTANIEGYPVC